ncbi:hypothetical protein ACFV4N_08250 [Actinosynnema sp. NPDC059797]
MTVDRAATAEDALRGVLLSEYEMLKAEQKSRIVARDRLMYATLAALAATTAASLGAAQAQLLLLLPPVCLILGWTYLVNDENISAIGDYLHDHLGSRLTGVLGGAAVFGWESVHRNQPGRLLRKSLQLCVDLAMFVVPAVLSVVGYWLTGPPSPVLVFASAVELASAVVLAIRIVCSANLTAKGKRR